MVGGTTSGYSLIGRRHIAISPTMKITMESTPAKIGRRIKKWEKFISFAWFDSIRATRLCQDTAGSTTSLVARGVMGTGHFSGTWGPGFGAYSFHAVAGGFRLFAPTAREPGSFTARHFFLRCDRHAGANALKAVDDDLVAGIEAIANDALAFDQRPELHRAILDRVRRGQGENELLRLVGADGALLDQQRGMTLAERHADAREKSGHNAAVGIGKHGAQQ